MKAASLLLALSAAPTAVSAERRRSEVWSRAEEDAWHKEQGLPREVVLSPRPQDTIRTEDLPDEFSWMDKDGVSYVTKNLNQHIPQCPSPPLLPFPSPQNHPRRSAPLVFPPAPSLPATARF